MSKLSIFVLVLFCSAMAGMSGAVAGYYAALSVPTVSSIAVLDIEELASRVDARSPDAANATKLLTAKAKEVTERLTAAGMVVLDRAAVVAAPNEAIVHVELTPSPETLSKLGAKQ